MAKIKISKLQAHHVIMDLDFIGCEIRCNPQKFDQPIFVNHIGKYMERAYIILKFFEEKRKLDQKDIDEYEAEKKAVMNIIRRKGEQDKNTITIYVKGGVVTKISNIANGERIIVIDLDAEKIGDASKNIWTSEGCFKAI